MLYLKTKKRVLKHAIITPFILVLIVPIVLLDIVSEIYHRICFPLYKFSYLKRKEYIKIDRHKLKYLSLWQKCFCLYCGYANGIANYWVRMAGETELYWCGIQHQKDRLFKAPLHHKNFAQYDNEEDFKKKYL